MTTVNKNMSDPDQPDRQCHFVMSEASERAAQTVLLAPEGTGDGRSKFYWLTFPNGDVMLGVFPEGETFFAIETDLELHVDPDDALAHEIAEALEAANPQGFVLGEEERAIILKIIKGNHA